MKELELASGLRDEDGRDDEDVTHRDLHADLSAIRARLNVYAAISAAVLSVLLMVVGSGAAWDKHVCEVRGDQLGVDSKWTWTTYCTVKQGDRWLDIDKYRFEIGD